MPSREQLLSAAVRLDAYLERRHLANGLLRGPDSGVRFNLRLWRFAKSALDFIPWRDDYAFMQTQGYWVLASWLLFEATGEARYRDRARQAAEAILKLQLPGGGWAYPLPERRKLIATVEGNWASIGLLATHDREPREELVSAAIRWHEFLTGRIGFQNHERGKAINYFDRPRGKIPNNSVEAAWFMARLWRATGDERFLDHVQGLVEFIAAVQLSTGELPYIVDGPYERARVHYLCFQYNAFQFLKLAWLADELESSDAPSGEARGQPLQAKPLPPGTIESLRAILVRLARFLERGVTAKGACAARCGRAQPELDYHTAVLAAALHEASSRSLAPSRGPGAALSKSRVGGAFRGRLRASRRADLSDRCYARLLERQSSDGGFGYSSGDYGFLHDRRSYPRALAMILFHLLYPVAGNGFPHHAES